MKPKLVHPPVRKRRKRRSLIGHWNWALVAWLKGSGQEHQGTTGWASVELLLLQCACLQTPLFLSDSVEASEVNSVFSCNLGAVL